MVQIESNCHRPIFITGVYRSGTTLISQILNNHSSLRIIHDTLHFFRFYLAKYNPVNETYTKIVQEASNRLLERYAIYVPKDEIIYSLDQLSDVSFRDVYNEIMFHTFCNCDTTLRWGEKSLIQWSNIPTFLQMFPHGQAIHVIRDPRDVLASYREMTNELPHKYLDAIFTCLHSMTWASNMGAQLDVDQYMVLKHEDLVTEPQQTLYQICKFLDIPYQANMMDFSLYKDQSGNDWNSNTSFNDIPNEITSASAYRWKNKLQPFEIALVESIIGNRLELFGYSSSNQTFTSQDLQAMWYHIENTPLIQHRLKHWLETGEGIESYPSDPTKSDNWESLEDAVQMHK